MDKLLILFSSLLFFQANANISNELLARTNSSNLCSRIPSQSCLSQLRSEKLEGSNNRGLETCRVEVANNTNLRGTCNNQLWEHGETCQSYDGCGVHLEVYRHMTHPSVQLFRTAFNLSLTNITSREVKFRYTDILTGNFTFCINFTTTSSAAYPIESLWYDCVFHYRKYESHPFQLEFLSDNQYGLLLFQIPAGKHYTYLFKDQHLIFLDFCQFYRKGSKKWTWIFVCSCSSQPKARHHLPGDNPPSAK